MSKSESTYRIRPPRVVELARHEVLGVPEDANRAQHQHNISTTSVCKYNSHWSPCQHFRTFGKGHPIWEQGPRLASEGTGKQGGGGWGGAVRVDGQNNLQKKPLHNFAGANPTWPAPCLWRAANVNFGRASTLGHQHENPKSSSHGMCVETRRTLGFGWSKVIPKAAVLRS